jgi:hypothetical protein
VCLFILKDTATIVAFKMANGAFWRILVHCGAIISLLRFVYNRKHLESSIEFQFFPIFKELESFIASAYDTKSPRCVTHRGLKRDKTIAIMPSS